MSMAGLVSNEIYDFYKEFLDFYKEFLLVFLFCPAEVFKLLQRTYNRQ